MLKIFDSFSEFSRNISIYVLVLLHINNHQIAFRNEKIMSIWTIIMIEQWYLDYICHNYICHRVYSACAYLWYTKIASHRGVFFIQTLRAPAGSNRFLFFKGLSQLIPDQFATACNTFFRGVARLIAWCLASTRSCCRWSHEPVVVVTGRIRTLNMFKIQTRPDATDSLALGCTSRAIVVWLLFNVARLETRLATGCDII